MVFDYFFPSLLPGSATSVPDELVNGWEGTYEPQVLQGLRRRPLAAAGHSSHLLLQLLVLRYGHCNFAPGEVLIGFYLLALNPLTQ